MGSEYIFNTFCMICQCISDCCASVDDGHWSIVSAIVLKAAYEFSNLELDAPPVVTSNPCVWMCSLSVHFPLKLVDEFPPSLVG